ncbi:MAG: hypothetical protein HYU64_05960 [Armatimonadetes bacterium]|nr:hypothetical protein [Armatimonadota bacterium]
MFSEEELLEECARGEERAWEELHKRYAGYVRRMVSWRKWGFSPSEVEEIVQEVFTDLIKGISQFRGQSTLATFVSRVTQNNCVSALRRAFAQKRGKEVTKVSLDEPDEEGKAFHIPPALDPPPEEVVLRREEAAELHRA